MFEAKDLVFHYGNGPRVLDHVSFTMSPGEVVGIVGESGSGKSTLARCLCGLLSPRAGEISLNGQVLSTKSTKETRLFRRRIQMVFQDPDLSLPRHLPVGIPLHDACRMLPASQNERQQTIVSYLATLGLPPDTMQRKPRALSGGQRQRVALLRAILVNPEILILDEVTSALDLSVQNQLLLMLTELRHQTGMTQIMITHDMRLALSFCERLIVLKAGRIVETGSPGDLLNVSRHPYTRALIGAIPSIDPSDRRLIAKETV